MPRKYTYDLFEPSSNNDESLDRLSKEFAPLHMQAWSDSKQKVYGKSYDLNVQAFAQLWLARSLKIFMAYDSETRAVGYLMGFHFRPMQYQATVFQVEDWFTAGNSEVEEGLFEYMYEGMRFMGVDEVLITVAANEQPIDLGPAWKVANTFKQVRYVRK